MSQPGDRWENVRGGRKETWKKFKGDNKDFTSGRLERDVKMTVRKTFFGQTKPSCYFM